MEITGYAILRRRVGLNPYLNLQSSEGIENTSDKINSVYREGEVGWV